MYWWLAEGDEIFHYFFFSLFITIFLTFPENIRIGHDVHGYVNRALKELVSPPKGRTINDLGGSRRDIRSNAQGGMNLAA